MRQWRHTKEVDGEDWSSHGRDRELVVWTYRHAADGERLGGWL